MGLFHFKEKDILAVPAEIHCVAQAIYAEAGGESHDGKRAVGHVIMNRTKQKRFGTSNPCIIIKQRGQFKYKTGHGRNWEESLRAAKNLGADLTNGSLFFKNLRSKVRWNYKFTIRIGGHQFYK